LTAVAKNDQSILMAAERSPATVLTTTQLKRKPQIGMTPSVKAAKEMTSGSTETKRL